MTPPTERPEFALAMRMHNEGEFYEAHEAWETIWRDEEDDRWRIFVQGLIQVTSAFHKLVFQREPGGASRLLARGLEKLSSYPADYLGFALGELRDGARACVDLFAEMEKDRTLVDRFDRTRIPKVRMI